MGRLSISARASASAGSRARPLFPLSSVGDAVCPQVVEESRVLPLLAVGGSQGWRRVGRVVGGEAWEMVPWDPGLGPVAAGKYKHRRTRTVGLGGLGSSSRVRFSQLQETEGPLLLPSVKTGQAELRGLGPQSGSHPVTFEIIIIIHDLEKNNK